MDNWLNIYRGDAPLVVTMPHTGGDLAGLDEMYRSPWLARRDADIWLDRLYGFVRDLGATTIHTAISRSVIDVNRDPSGASLYPGMATTELCPTATFDGERLYRKDGPDAMEVDRRLATWHAPYHRAIVDELARLRQRHGKVVLYDAHSIRSRIPRLFDGELPNFNIGTNNGNACDPALADRVAQACGSDCFSHVVDGRFKGGWTTRHHGDPSRGIHAIQMETAIRTYCDEPDVPDEASWPTPYDSRRAAAAAGVLDNVIKACLEYAKA